MSLTTTGTTVYIQNASWNRIATITADTGSNIIKDAIGVDTETWVTLNFTSDYGNTTTGSAPMNIRVYRYIPEPQGILVADINPVSVPDSVLGQYSWAGSGSSYRMERPNRIMHQVDANTIALIGVYNDGGTNRMGVQFITAA